MLPRPEIHSLPSPRPPGSQTVLPRCHYGAAPVLSPGGSRNLLLLCDLWWNSCTLASACCIAVPTRFLLALSLLNASPPKHQPRRKILNASVSASSNRRTAICGSNSSRPLPCPAPGRAPPTTGPPQTCPLPRSLPPAPGSSTTQIQPKVISGRDIKSRSLPQARTWLLPVSCVSRTCLVRGGSGDTLGIAGFPRFSPPSPRAPIRSANLTLPRRPPPRWLRLYGQNDPRPIAGQVKVPGKGVKCHADRRACHFLLPTVSPQPGPVPGICRPGSVGTGQLAL